MLWYTETLILKLVEIKEETKGLARGLVEHMREGRVKNTYLFMEPSSIGDEAEGTEAMA
jgi:hypothetical protein